MFELTIEGQVYGFKFGLGFMREINKKVVKNVEGVKQELGLQMAIAGIIDGDAGDLIDVLNIANKTEKPRVTQAQLDAYIESEDTDIDRLFDEVLDFLKRSNVTKKKTEMLLKEVERRKAMEENR